MRPIRNAAIREIIRLAALKPSMTANIATRLPERQLSSWAVTARLLVKVGARYCPCVGGVCRFVVSDATRAWGAPERIVPLPIMGAVVAYLIIRLSL